MQSDLAENAVTWFALPRTLLGKGPHAAMRGKHVSFGSIFRLVLKGVLAGWVVVGFPRFFSNDKAYFHDVHTQT